MSRKSVVRINDHRDMTSAFYHGHKARNQANTLTHFLQHFFYVKFLLQIIVAIEF